MPTIGLLPLRVERPRAALPVLEKGFRPFFLVGAAFAVFAVPLWIVALRGGIEPGGRFGPMQWHAHEMLFGFSTAIIAGFLLTAIGNWTGRKTVAGWPLAGLVVLWSSGRAAMLFASELPRAVPMSLDVAFLPLLAIACARPLFATNNRRNYGFVGVLAGLTFANVVAHWAALHGALETVAVAHRFALSLIVVMLVLVTGRVVPMFTRNATRMSWIRPIPWLEGASITTVALMAFSELLPRTTWVDVLLPVLASALLLARMRFWGSRHVLRQPLLWILHVGTLFIPFGFALRALSAAIPSIPVSSALHALTAGGIGCLTLGMMARVSLGHTGRPLEPARSTHWAFACLTTAAWVRIGAPFLPSAHYLAALSGAAVLWSSAFALYLLGYLSILSSARADAR